jgi:hypothetical protein
MLGMFGSRSGKRAGDAGRRAISDPQRSLPSSSHNPEERYTLCTDSPPMRHRYPALFGCAVEKVAKVWAAPIPHRLRIYVLVWQMISGSGR